jgi:Subtilisin inhibitor-like
MKPDILRARTGARYLVIAAICAAAATACGSTAAPAGSAAGASPAAPKVSLDIKVTGAPGTAAKHWTLQCDPPGGTHPDPAKACATLLKAKTPFAPVPKGMSCPMIMVGTRTATVTGTYFGKHVDTTFVQGGCDIPRWAQIGQIFN